MSKLAALKEATRLIELPSFLLCGTLLGAMRDGELIPWDHDVDIGIWAEDRKRLPIANLPHVMVIGDEPKWAYRLLVGSIGVDVFFVHRTPDGCWFNVGGKFDYHYPRIDSLTTVQLDGQTFNVPENWEECLVANYGNGWKRPVHYWKWQSAPCSRPAMSSAVR